MKRFIAAPMSVIAAAVLAACSTLPSPDSPLSMARSDYNRAQSDPQVTSLAAGELRQAGESLEKANAASNKGESKGTIDHLAYVAKQQVAIAEQTARQKAAEIAVASAGAERDRVRLEARTREADAATRSAEASQRSAEASQRSAEASQRRSEASRAQSANSQRDAEASQRNAEASQRSADASQRQAMVQQQAANDAQMNAEASRQQAMDAEGRARKLEAQLKDMEAKKTERGMIVTLGDVLFDTDRAQLKPVGMRNVQKLADFFKQYPERKVMIEGFTDSTGTNRHNMELSEQRAGSVRSALLGMGVGTERITSRGYGESYPAAGNETAEGRQLNRRVEIVVSNDAGNISPR